MTEVAPPTVDLDRELQAITARTPWIQEKTAAINGLLVAIGNESLSDPVARYRLDFVGDSEFQDPRIALRFDTDEQMARLYDRYNSAGQRDFGSNFSSLGHVTRELNGYPQFDVLWARNDGGLYVRQVARVLATGLGTLRLALSEQYERDLLKH